MHLLSVNIGQKRTQPKGNELETTGIYKLPTQEPVEIKLLGIQSDFICDQKNHGGSASTGCGGGKRAAC